MWLDHNYITWVQIINEASWFHEDERRQEVWILDLGLTHFNYTIRFKFKVIALTAIWRKDLWTFGGVRVEAGKQLRGHYVSLSNNDNTLDYSESRKQLDVELMVIGCADGLDVGWERMGEVKDKCKEFLLWSQTFISCSSLKLTLTADYYSMLISQMFIQWLFRMHQILC